ncbi:MAG TPA: hypothetical protein VHB01_10500 [Nitrosospira sp.]|nr:hypothetical protein [Nitrosospira sp.]
MKPVSVFTILRSGLLALAACGLMSSAGAQMPGPGQVGGMGQGGAPTGEFPSYQGGRMNDFPPERTPEEKNKKPPTEPPSDSSGKSSPPPEKRSAGEKTDPSVESDIPESGSPDAADADAKRK